MIRPFRIIITTGDTDGVGLEVTVKSLLRLGPQKDCTFYYFRAPGNQERLAKRLAKKFDVVSVNSWPEAVALPVKSRRQLVEILSLQSPALWVETAALACNTGSAEAVVTAPLSKTCIKHAGLSDIGHTEILKRMCGVDTAFMAFVGQRFNVVLATGHLPLSAVSSSLTEERLFAALGASKQLRPLFAKRLQKKPLAILGLNPHAGDSGIIGSEEEFWIRRFVGKAATEVSVVGPLPPDSAFQKENWPKYSCYIALYHDQGLIPFKLVHGHDSGVHITLGLPIIRTSVDHGTAKDIFGKNRANPNSMIDAIRTAQLLVRG